MVAARAGRTGVPALNPFVLAGGPLVEGLVHHQQAQAVAQVVLLGRHGVMGAADGVDTQFLQSLQPALQGRFGKGRAEGAQVVVQTNAFELERLAVEEETVVRVEAGRAEAEGRAGFVGERAGNVSARHGGVQIGRVQRPESRLRHCGLLREDADAALRQALLGGNRGHFMAGGVFDGGGQLDLGIGVGLIDDGGLDGDQGLRVADHGCVDIGFPLDRVYWRGDGEPNMPVDAAAGVKARIGRNGVVNAHRHQVGSWTEIEVSRKLVLERRISVRPVAEEVAVDPHVAVAVDAVEG